MLRQTRPQQEQLSNPSNPPSLANVRNFSETDDRFNDDAYGSTSNNGNSDGDEREPRPGMCLTSEALDLVALAGVVGDQAGEHHVQPGRGVHDFTV